MLRFVGRKMLNKKWMIASLLVGNLLLVAIAASSPMYSQAVLQKVLTSSFSQKLTASNVYPMCLTLTGSSTGPSRAQEGGRELFPHAEQLMLGLSDSFGLPAVEHVWQYSTSSTRAVPVVQREEDKEVKSCRVGFLSDMEEHISLVGGELFPLKPPQDGVLDVIVSESALNKLNLLIGEELTLSQLADANGDPFRVRITGVFRSRDNEDVYWVNSVNSYQDWLFVSEEVFRSLFMEPEDTPYILNGTWISLLDYRSVRTGQVEEILSTLEETAEYSKTALKFSLHNNFQSILEPYRVQAVKLNTTLFILQTPIFILLGAFIFMVSQQMLSMEQNEIAVIKSRGAKKRQILSIYLQQSVMIALLSLAAGIPLGFFICQVLGASNDFLEFVQRKALPVEVNPASILFALVAAAVSVGAMVIPAFRHSNVTIVGYKQKKTRKSSAPWWQKCFLDVILLAVSLYGYYTFQGRQEFLTQQILNGGAMEPLLYFSSSMFMIGAGLLGIRLVPLLCRLVFQLGKRWWSPAAYTAFLRVTRTQGSQSFIMLFLVLTLSMGIFNAEAARSINDNAERRIRYSTGADVVVREKWADNSASSSMMSGPGGPPVEEAPKEKIYYEPDFLKYQQLEGVKSYTKVYHLTDASAQVNSGRINKVTLLGIHTREFGQTAWFDEALLPAHWYEYLNAMSQDSRAILVSSNFRERYGYETGDVMSYSNADGKSVRGIIYGFVDYWPGFAPSVRSRDNDGLYSEKENFLIVASFSQLKASWGVFPYEVWFQMEGSSRPIYEFAEEKGIRFPVFEDTQSKLTAMKNDPVYQGTNGVLTVGFIVVLLLCCTGFLIYWILSIRSRELQFGIFRAMGMSMREILSMLLVEQPFISGSAIAIGVLVGKLASALYIPLVQIAYTSVDQVLPLEIVSSQSDYARLFAVTGIMIAVCMAILSALVSKVKISQALKLGED